MYWMWLVLLRWIWKRSSCKVSPLSPNKTRMTQEYSVAEVVVNFILQNHWKHILVLTDKDPKGFTRLLSTFLLTSAFIRLPPNGNLSSHLIDATLNHERNNLIIWCEVNFKLELTNLAHGLGFFGRKFTWIFIHEAREDFQEFVGTSITEKALFPDSQVFSLIFSRQPETQHLTWKVVQLSHGKLNSSNLIKIITLTDTKERRKIMGMTRYLPLKGYDLKIGTFKSPPFVTITRKGPQAEYGGFTTELINILSQYLGFSYNYVVEKRPVYGSYHNGNWTGLVGRVYRKEVDIGAVYFALTRERNRDLDFSAPFYTTQNCAVIRRPKAMNEEWSLLLYVEPFSWVVWVSCGAMCALVLVCFTFTVIAVWFDDQNKTRSILYQSKIGEVVWNIICILLQTGIIHTPSVFSSKMIFLSFTLFIILTTKAYLSLLTASLTMKAEPKQYENLDELLDDGKFGISMLGQTSIYDEFRDAKYGTFHRAWKKMQSDPASIAPNTDVGFERTLNEDYVYITAEPVSIPRIRRSNCQLELLKECFMKKPIGLLLPKRSPITQAVSLKIMSMKSSGILEKLEEKYLPPLDPSDCTPKPSMTVPIRQFSGAFAILILGILGAVSALFVEKVYENHLLIELRG